LLVQRLISQWYAHVFVSIFFRAKDLRTRRRIPGTPDADSGVFVTVHREIARLSTTKHSPIGSRRTSEIPAVPIQCPYCQNTLSLKEAKPGRYTPRCPKCREPFQLDVPEDPDQAPVASKVRSVSANEIEVADSAAPTAPYLPTTAPVEPAPATSTPTPTRPSGSGQAGFTPSAPVAGTGPAPEEPQGDLPSSLGGYRIVRRLGRGAMGTVYLARQRLLQRSVALKVMRPEWARNPTFVSRLTREAYAAAQLRHPNIVPIDDFGEAGGTPYFGMEYVQGPTLAALVRERAWLEPEVAAGYVLQAARGLNRAHDQGLIHHDIKPENLLLDSEGVVKVADLGLVKTPSVAEVEAAMEAGVTSVTRPIPRGPATGAAPITLVNAAMGTPAFMAPEQGRDATRVDARADIYSLGCTLYDLATGRPPFEGKTALELIAKHQNEPMVPPETIVPRVPRALSEIILKMTAKRPEDRPANLGEVITALEEFLGLPTAGVFSPREEQASLLTQCARAFNQAPTAQLRRKVTLGASAGCALVVLLSALAHQPFLAGGFLGLGLMTALAYFVAAGVRRKTSLFLKALDFFLGGSLVDWLIVAAVLALLVTLLLVFHLFWAWVAFGILAILAAVYLEATIDRQLEAERKEAVERTRAMLRGLRLTGLDEEALRQFVCTYSGDRWEEFYETLFGYEAMRVARRNWGRGEDGRRRPRFAPWRDGVHAWLVAKQQARRAEREKRLLQKIEEKGLEAQGVNLMTARRKAQRIAEAMVAVAAEWKAAARLPAAARETPLPPIARALREAALNPEGVLVERERGLTGRSVEERLGLFVGPKLRFLVGALLMAGFLAWVHQNEIVTSEHLAQLKEAASRAAETQDVKALQEMKLDIKLDKPTRELQVTMPAQVPAHASRVFRLFNGFHPGVAGLILLVSSLFRGVRVGLFAFAGAAVALLGPALGLPRIGPLDPNVASMALGAAVGLIGILFFRSRD
jgi:membrane protein implicated in regulation of membrane protease activity